MATQKLIAVVAVAWLKRSPSERAHESGSANVFCFSYLRGVRSIVR